MVEPSARTILVDEPFHAKDNVPEEVIGDPETVNIEGVVKTTLVTVPVVGVTQDSDPAVAPAVNTLPLLVVPVAGTCKFPSAVECEKTPVELLYSIGEVADIAVNVI